jgi:tetratricopeptide (TPR) repeat protein
MKRHPAFRFWAPVLLLGATPMLPVVCVDAHGQTNPSGVQPLLDKAHALEVRGHMDLAAQTWKQVLLTDPNNTEALGGLARAAKLNGDLTLAGSYLDRLRAINPNDPGIARVEQMSTQATSNAQLQQAGKLAQQGQYGQAMNIYRQLYGNNPPPGDIALGYYETESATEDGRPHAIAGLRNLVATHPGDSRYQIALGRILTYSPKTRPEGRRILEQHSNDPDAVEALRQSLLWDAQNPATAGDIRAYLARHPDTTLSTVLQHEPRTGRLTAGQRAAAEVNATRTAEDRAAYRALNEKHLDDAEKQFKTILAKTPDDPNALAGMGYIRMQQANFGGAISFLVQAKSDGSKDPGLEPALATSRFWYTMAEGAAALEQNDLPAAEKQYRAALSQRPDSIEALDGLGGTLLKAQRPEAAAPIFAQYIKVKPSAPHAWRGLFLAEVQSGNANRALESERQTPATVRAQLAKDPLYLQALASAYSAAGRDADAQRVLQSALDLPFPANDQSVETDTKLQYAALLQQAGRYDQAAGLYREVLAKSPNNIDAYQGLIRVQHAANQDAQAVQTLDAMPPDVYSAAMRNGGFDDTVASVYQSQGRLDVAQDILEKSLQQEAANGEKPSVTAQTQLAGIYLQRGNPAQAYPLFQQVLSQHPDDLNAWQGLVDALHSTGRDQEALAQVQQSPPAIRAQLETRVDFLQTVGGIYAGLGQPQEAQVFLRRVQAHYAASHSLPPADVDIQQAWLLYNSMDDAGLYRQLMYLGSRQDLSEAQRRTVQTIWINFAVRRASQATAAGKPQLAVSILNAAAHTFADHPTILKALAGGYARAGQPQKAVAIWKSMNLTTADRDDYRSAIGAALAAQDEKDAETWLRFALVQYPKDPEILILGAKFEQQRGDINRAADYYRVAIQDLPKDDPGAALTGELGQAGASTGTIPGTPLPGSSRSTADLSTLLAPGANTVSPSFASPAPAQPYLPGSMSPGMAPMPYGQSYQVPMPATDEPAIPAVNPSPSPAPGSSGRLRDYVPHALLRKPLSSLPGQLPPSVADTSSEEGLPLLSPASFQQLQVVRLTERAAAAKAPLTLQPAGLRVAFLDGTAAGLAQGATYRLAAYYVPQQSSQASTQTTGQQSTGTTPDSTVYGPYVPYVPPAKKQPLTAQPAGPAQAQGQQAKSPQPQVPQPGTTQPLTTTPSGQTPAAANGSTVVNGIVYGPYVPYVPPAKTEVHLGSTPPARQISQPELTDVLPTAKYAPGTKPKPGASRPDLAAARAAAERRKAAAAAAATTGQSKPPAEEYSTPPVEPVQYTTPAQTAPQTAAPVYNQTAPVAPPIPQGPETYGQQYPQPRTSTAAVRHARRPTQKVAAAPAATPTPAAAAVDRAPTLSYPGVGSPLGDQPYPSIGRAYPLPPAPTDYDLSQRQLPPLRGSYETVLPPQVPLTQRQQAERDLAALEASYSGWLGGTGSARYRSGVVGYDRLTDLETNFEASYVAANNIRFTVVPKAVFLNSGQLDTVNYTGVQGSPVIGTFNTATATVNPQQQSANGVGGEFQVTGRNFGLAVGYTPYEFLVQNYTGRVLFKPNNHFTLLASREQVTETQLSYAGLRDPGSATLFSSGNIWGGVIQTGGGVRLDLGDEKSGFYISADGADITGYHVLENSKFEGAAGAYFLAHTFPGYGRLNVGVSAFGEHYAHNERELSYGLGGYFSPSAYLLASVPVTFIGRYGSNFHYTINGAVGVQTFTEDSQLYFPLDRGTQTGFQTGLNCTTAQVANHTCGQYPVNSNTGGNYSINTEGAYRVGDHWYAGGFLSANNTNNYNTVTGGFFVRYLFRPQITVDDTPTGLFPIEGFRPLRVP